MRFANFKAFVFTITLLPSSFLFSINAHIQTDIFYSKTQPYVEILVFLGPQELYWTTVNDSLKQTSVKMTLLLRQEGKLKKVEPFEIRSAPVKQFVPLLYALRWSLSPGTYELESQIQVADSVQSVSVFNSFDVLSHKTEDIFMSTIQLVSSFTENKNSQNPLVKHGFQIEPLPDFSLYKEQFYLHAFFETYNTILFPSEKYILKYTIQRKDSSGIYQMVNEFFKTRMKKEIDPIFFQYDFSSFPSGDYQLNIDMLNAKGVPFDSQKISFVRHNPFWDKIAAQHFAATSTLRFFQNLPNDSVDYALKAMFAIIPSLDLPVLQFMKREKKYEEKKLYLNSFWQTKGKNPVAEFQRYIALADIVDQLYTSGFGYGFETDRGITMLRYGQPDQIIKEDYDNGAFPYEIWKYDKIIQKGQTNVRFLFYNPDLAGSDFRLLHSTAIGEISNRKWEYELYLNAKGEFQEADVLDRNGLQSNFNRRAREYFDN